MARLKSDRRRAFDQALGVELRGQRKAAGLTQTMLGSRLGINAVTIHHYESGRQSIPLYSLLRIAAILRVSFGDIVGPVLKRKLKSFQNGNGQNEGIV